MFRLVWVGASAKEYGKSVTHCIAHVIASLTYSQTLSSGEDHDCCFQPTQGGYDCKNDPSFACETYKACEILFQSNPADEFSAGFDGDGGSSSSRPTAQEMALIEESVHQFCSSGTVGIGMGKCQEICQGKLPEALRYRIQGIHGKYILTDCAPPVRYRSSLLL